MRSRHDEAWKTLLAEILPSALAYFMPDLYNDMDKEKPCTFMEQELRAISKKLQKNYLVDVLAHVPILGGEERCVLLHVEVQGKANDPASFPERMFRYYARIWDHHQQEVTALAILTDKTGLHTANQYTASCYGARVVFDFNVYRVAEADDDALLASENPMALAVYAAKKALTLRGNISRLNFNLDMVRLMKRRGYSLDLCKAMLHFLDGILPVEGNSGQEAYIEELKKVEEGDTVAYLTVIERVAMRKGRKEGLEEGMEKGMEKGMVKGMEKGMEKGISKAHLDVVHRMLDKGAPVEKIMEYTGLTAFDIEEMARKTSN